MNRYLILLPTALFIFCAGCSSPKPNEPPKPGKFKGHKLVGNVLDPTWVAQTSDGVCGFLRVKYAPGSQTPPTTWRYRLYPSGPWSAQELDVGESVELTGAIDYDIDFIPSAGHTVAPDPYIKVRVKPDKKTVVMLYYQ